MTDPRYPIGPFTPKPAYIPAERDGFVAQLRALPGQLRAAVHDLDDAQLGTPYREGGWTVRQVVHHVPDSHLNAYVRVKLALTEEQPIIKPYEEDRWASLPDAAGDIDVSLQLLAALHERWASLFTGLPGDAWSRAFVHPAAGRMTVEQALAGYAWHGLHHLAHVTHLRERRRWGGA